MVCRQNKECVQCVAYGTGKKKDNCQECKARNYISKEDVLSGKYRMFNQVISECSTRQVQDL